ncbi:MAG: DUF4190 domain-containing protein [Phycisphaerales bacterium]|nr:DUF4190 domain-containing protein [Phycisphaerales bacterium]
MSNEQNTVQYSPAPQQTSGKAIASMVLGICSIITCWAYGIPGIICGILAIVFAKHAFQRINDGLAPETSAGMAKAGKICGWVGLCLSIAYLLFIVVYVIIIVGLIGAAAASGNAPTLLPF